jgi:hypothetical protein
MFDVKTATTTPPLSGRKGPPNKYPFEALWPGQYFTVPRADTMKVRGTLAYWGSKLGARYSTRTVGLELHVYCVEREGARPDTTAGDKAQSETLADLLS